MMVWVCGSSGASRFGQWGRGKWGCVWPLSWVYRQGWVGGLSLGSTSRGDGVGEGRGKGLGSGWSVLKRLFKCHEPGVFLTTRTSDYSTRAFKGATFTLVCVLDR